MLCQDVDAVCMSAACMNSAEVHVVGEADSAAAAQQDTELQDALAAETRDKVSHATSGRSCCLHKCCLSSLAASAGSLAAVLLWLLLQRKYQHIWQALMVCGQRMSSPRL